MLAEVVHALRCPQCGDGLVMEEQRLLCRSGHSFDVARQGYVTLMPGRGTPHRGDDAAMVAAREVFLGSGCFDGLRDAVARTAVRALSHRPGPATVVDVGAGTGYYLAEVLERLPDCTGIAVDSSRHALRRAARAHPRIGAVGCDVWAGLPVRDQTAALVLDVFSPRNGPEFARVLQPHGRLVVVTPTRGHLAELVGPLGLVTVDDEKPQRLASELAGSFALDRSDRYEESLDLTDELAAALIKMGPSARHLSAREIDARVAGLLPGPQEGRRLTVTASLDLSVYRRA